MSVDTEVQGTPEITEVEKLRALAIKQAAEIAVKGIFARPDEIADVLTERLTFDAASGTVKGLDGRTVEEHRQELYEFATHKGNKVPETHVTPENVVELAILSKADLKTPDEKSAYITKFGFKKFEELPLDIPRGDGQILAKSDLTTPAAKSKWISEHPGEYEGLPLVELSNFLRNCNPEKGSQSPLPQTRPRESANQLSRG